MMNLDEQTDLLKELYSKETSEDVQPNFKNIKIVAENIEEVVAAGESTIVLKEVQDNGKTVTENINKITSEPLLSNISNAETNANDAKVYKDEALEIKSQTQTIKEETQVIKDGVEDIATHTESRSNPHVVTKAQVGLSNVDNTSDADKPISNATLVALNELDSSISNKVASSINTNPDSITNNSGVLTFTNSYFNYTAGITDKGYALTSRDVTKTVDVSGASDGIKWVSENSDGTNSFFDNKPSYGIYDKTNADDNRPVIDADTGKVYSTTGGELLVGTTFEDGLTGNWTGVNAAVSIESGMLKVTNNTTNGYATQSITTVVGEEISISFDAISSSAYTSYEIYDNGILVDSVYTISGSTNYTITLVPTSTTVEIRLIAQGTVNGDFNRWDNISTFKKEATIDAEILPAPSFMQNPVYIENGVPQYIDYSQELEVNYMDSINVKSMVSQGNIETKGEFIGKNACTAWVNFDGTTTPPTIRDSFNVSSVIRVATGSFDVYFNSQMDNRNYVVAGTGVKGDTSDDGNYIIQAGGANNNYETSKTLDKVNIKGRIASNIVTSESVEMQILIFGGKTND